MKNRIGIRKEDKYVTEKRAPLTPDHVAKLIKEHQIDVVVEPSTNRLFKEKEYQRAGATISEDLTACNIVFGVKEIPWENFTPKQNYCFFSHTIKGQSYNMPMLKRMLDLRNTLIDYEKVTDDQGRRIIFFGHFAGYAGMIDSLWAFGKRLKWEGIKNPFDSIRQAREYDSLNDARKAVQEAGRKISKDGVPDSLVPLVFGFAGYGHVSQGAQEIFNMLPYLEISPSELASFMKTRTYSNKMAYKVVFKESDIARPKIESAKFRLQDYYSHPEKYESRFEEYLPHLTVLMNGIYWEPRYPKLLTKSYLKNAYSQDSKQRLRVIGDITCDIEGSIECNVKSTSSLNPVYVWNPLAEKEVDGWEGTGPVVLAVDKLPSELPREASQVFGEDLLPFVPALANADFNVPFKKLEIPVEFKRAVIAHDGLLTPDYKYIEQFLRANV